MALPCCVLSTGVSPVRGGQTIAPKGEVTGAGQRPMTPAERLNLDEAMRQAALRMLGFLGRRYGLSRDDAYSLLSVAGDFGVTQVVDQRMGIHAGVPKAAFPPRR